MERIANNLPTFEGDISNYDAAYQSLLNHFSDLVTHMTELNAMWEGEAHDEFLTTFHIDEDKVNQMNDDFKEVLQELKFADKEYTTNENNIASIIDELEA